MSGRTFGYCFHSLYELIGLLFTVALAFLQGVKRAILGPFLKRPLKEWTQDRSFDTLQECESYREKQADEFIKRMETVPEGSSAHKTYDDAARRYLLGRCNPC